MTARDDREADWAARLHSAGLRTTPRRQAVLDWLHAHPHAGTGEILQGVRDGGTVVTEQALHAMLGELAARGLVRRIELPDDHGARYETRSGDNHHHIQCVVCGRIEDVDCVFGSAPCLQPNDPHGMRVLEADITFRGVCAECEARLDAPEPRAAAVLAQVAGTAGATEAAWAAEGAASARQPPPVH